MLVLLTANGVADSFVDLLAIFLHLNLFNFILHSSVFCLNGCLCTWCLQKPEEALDFLGRCYIGGG